MNRKQNGDVTTVIHDRLLIIFLEPHIELQKLGLDADVPDLKRFTIHRNLIWYHDAPVDPVLFKDV